MKKDVIYIDTEDDITGIIDRVKQSDSPIVALVPPKRTGILQSTVNLKLLQRAAEAGKKRVVLITNDPALKALAAGLALPVAKNLQSKPEIAEIAALDSDDGDVIDGEELPVGELAAAAAGLDAIDQETDNAKTGTSAALAATAVENQVEKPTTKGTGVKIPNFDIFRKKLFLFSALGVLLVVFLVWALFFAPRATVAITAKTNLVNINKTLQLKPDAKIDTTQGVLPVITKQVKKTASIDFAPTGKKDVGTKATGTVTLTPTIATKLAVYDGESVTIAAGSGVVSSSGLSYTTNSAVTFSDSNKGATAVGVTAVENGAKYNGATGPASKYPPGTTAVFTTATSGGTDKTVTVVSADDISKAAAQLQAQDANSVRNELAKQFTSADIVITEAYVVEQGTPIATPAVDQEASAAKLTAETTYTLLGIKRADLKAVYDAYLATQLKGDTSQKVYKSGDEATQFSDFQKGSGTYSIRAIAAAQVGPNIDSKKVANDAKGKQVGEVKQSLESIQGVESVKVTLSPFWVTRVPNDAAKINVTFVLQND